MNIPVIAFCDTDAPLRHVDVAIPANNKSKNSVALLYWLLAREILRMRATINRRESWGVMVDLFMYREPEEADKAHEVVETAVVVGETTAEETNFAEPTEQAKLEWGADVGTEEAPFQSGGEFVPANTNWQGNWDQTQTGTPAF